MKPLALDLCCGKGGWTNGLLATGWDVIGVDIEDMGGYPSHLIFADVREIAKDVEAYFPALKFDLVVASPPCQEFSYRSFPFKRCRELAKNVPPDKSIWEACEKIAKDLKAPLILENVRGAKPYMGPSAWHYGAFHFWGEMPALIPIGNPRKGFTTEKNGYPSGAKYRAGKHKGQDRKDLWINRTTHRLERDGKIPYRETHKGFAEEYEREGGLNKKFSRGESAHTSSKSSARKEWSARIAMIPLELSSWIGEIYYPMEFKVSPKLRGEGRNF